jgi:hypothetical protein
MADVQQCVEIIWAATWQLRAIPGQELKLQQARLEIARLVLAGGTSRFPPPRPYSSDDGDPSEYRACERAVTEASQQLQQVSAIVSSPPERTVVVLWPSSEGQPPDADPDGRLSWTREPAVHAVAILGPMTVHGFADRFVYFFFYDRDTLPASALTSGITAAPMLVPDDIGEALRRLDRPTLDAARSTPRVSRGRYVFGSALVFAALVVFLLSSIGIYYTALLVEHVFAVKTASGGPAYDAERCAADHANDFTAWSKNWAETGDCGRPWTDARRQVRVFLALFDGAPTALAKPAKAEDAPSVARGWSPQISLRGNLFGLAGAIVLLLIGAGNIALGRWDGVFIDERNRVSLSRIQITLWTIVLLSGIITLGLWNAFLATPGIGATAASLLETGPYPSMAPELWATLGLALGTPFASALMLRQRQATQDPPTEAAPPKPGIDPSLVKPNTVLDERLDPAAAGLADLILGEDATNRDRVDISRLQSLVITIALVFTYAQMLINLVSERISSAHARDIVVNHAGWFFPEMPPVGATFLGLLFASHAAYLGFKYAGSAVSPVATSR